MIKLKILFKNTTQYTKKVYDKFLEFHRKKYRMPYIAFNVIIIACILFCLILQIQYHNFNVAILICVILTVFILWRYLHPIFEIEKEYKSDKTIIRIDDRDIGTKDKDKEIFDILLSLTMKKISEYS